MFFPCIGATLAQTDSLGHRPGLQEAARRGRLRQEHLQWRNLWSDIHPEPTVGAAREMTGRTLAAIATALWITVAGCNPPPPATVSRCGPGGIAGLAPPEPIWTHTSPDSIYYAPRGVDLEDDGKVEILIGGGNEVPAFGEVVALDGETGRVRWRATADTELYSSPVLLDVTGDGVKDVFIGGRLQAFMAVDGASGDVLWRFTDPRPLPEYYFYNFYTPVLIPDQTGDGLPDLLVANGGGDGIRPREARPPGHLAVLGSADGALVAVAVLPDRQETYMSPILLPDAGTDSPTILFGTGGESWAGGLYETTLSAVLAGDLSGARRIVQGAGKGMIAPPALADLDRDGRLDIVVATFDGRLIAFNGATKAILWDRSFENSESYTTPALGFFDDDDVPDVYAVFLHGVFPNYSSAARVLLSGRDGSVLWQGVEGDFAMAGDVAVDLDGNGTDEVIVNGNAANDPLVARASQQQLYLVDSARRDVRPWGMPLGAFAAGSPWLGDLDADGCLDMVLPRHSWERDTNNGLLTRFALPAPVPANIRWGGYFGTRFDSVVLPR
jgi:outer membrane protein assembly factor BamB